MQSTRRAVLTKCAVFGSISLLVGCGSESEKRAVAPAPLPSVTASVAPAATSASVASSSSPPFALVEAPHGDFCTFDGAFPSGLSLRARPTKDSPDLLFVDALPSNPRATLVAPEIFFVDLDVPAVHARGFTSIDEIQVNRAFTFRDVLTIAAGASVKIGMPQQGHVTLTPESVTWLTWKNDVPTVEGACTDLTLARNAQPPTSATSGATFVSLTGAHDVFAKTDAAPVATATDAGLFSVIATKPGFLQLQRDSEFSHFSFWVKALGLKPKKMTPAEVLSDQADHMQMQMLAALGGGTVSGAVGALGADASAPPRTSMRCGAITFAIGRSAKVAIPMASMTNVDLVAREADGALVRVELSSYRNAAWFAARGMQTFARREDLDACKALP